MRWLTPKEVAERLSLSYRAVLDLIYRDPDPIPAYLPPGHNKQARIREDDLEAWIERRYVTCR